MNDYKRILIINLGGIGDLLLSIPSLKALREHFSEAKISLFVVPRVFNLVKDWDFIDEVLIFYKDYFHIINNFITLLYLRRQNFDLAINMRTIVNRFSAFMINFILKVIKPKIKVGRNTDGRGYFFDLKVPETLIGDKYEREYDIETVEALGVKVKDKDISISFDKESIDKIDKIFKEKEIKENDILIGMHLGGLSSHRWPIENFAYVAEKLYSKTKAKFLITGDKKEKVLAKRFLRLTRISVVDLSGLLEIKDLFVLISRLHLFISNDTGPIHIAGILRVPLVVIFGPGYLKRYDPRNLSQRVVVFHKDLKCSPCDKIKCKSKRCLREILPEEVFQGSLRLLETFK